MSYFFTPLFSRRVSTLALLLIAGLVFAPSSSRAQTAHSGAAVNFGSIQVGSSSAAMPVTFTFDSGGTIQAPAVLTMGAANLDFTDAGTGTCTTNGTGHTYKAGDTCTVNVKFSPNFAGARNGGVVIKNSSSAAIATAYVYGIGLAPLAVFSPSAITTLGGGFVSPSGVAVDGTGNIYVADSGQNVLEEIPAGCASTACMTNVGGGFLGLSSVAIDGTGNIYVTDSGHNAVDELLPGCASSACVTTLGGGFYFPGGIAVDRSGNVYVVSRGDVNELPPGCTSSACVTTLASGLSNPFGVTVDISGNVYVTNKTAVMELPPGCASSTCGITLGGGLLNATGIAVDAIGNVYVDDSEKGAVKEMPAGCSSSACVTTLLGGLTNPVGLGVDGSGNVYVTEFIENAVKEIQRTTPASLGFAWAQIGETSQDSPQSAAITNVGNSPLIFAIPSTGSNPSVPASFMWDGASTCKQTGSDATTAFSLDPAASCTIAIDFEPMTEGTITGNVVLTSNASPSAQQIPVSGNGATILISPTPGSVLGGYNTFTWNQGSGMDGFQFYVGTTGPGSRDIYWGPDLPGAATSSASINIPFGGATLYVRLWFQKGGIWQYQDFLYAEATPPSITSPSTSTALGGPTNFKWNPGSGIHGFQVKVGTTGPGSANVYWGPDLPATSTSSASINLPLDGATIYVRLWYQGNNSWQYQDYTYTEATPPAMISPLNTLPIGVNTFIWNPGTGSKAFQLYIGDGQGSQGLHDIYTGPDLPSTATTSGPPFPLPVGGPFLVTLWYLVNTTWFSNTYTYYEATSITSPVPGTFVAGPTVFRWIATGGSSALYQILIGTTGPGSSDLFSGPFLPETGDSSGVINIPVNGATVYVRLMTFLENWQHLDYTYREVTPPSMSTPAPGSTLGSSSSFTWNPGSGPSNFQLYIGTTGVGSSNVYKGPDLSGSTTSTRSISVPTNGATLNVRLWYLVNTSWFFRDYTYTEGP